jgi:hypothetical protein
VLPSMQEAATIEIERLYFGDQPTTPARQDGVTLDEPATGAQVS